MKALRRLALLAFGFPVLAHAHPGHEGHDLTWDFASGLAHPLTGWDHVMALLAVGLWAAQLGGRARRLLPAASITVMMLGAAVSRTGMMIPGLEQMLAASVLVLGLLIAATVRLPVAAGMGLVGLFAGFHGYAHGAEMPVAGDAISYGMGFLLATAFIQAAGLVLGSAIAARSTKAVQAAGWGLAACGVALLAV